ELPAGGLLGNATEALAGGDVVVDDHVEVRFEVGHGLPVERDDVFDVEHPADNDLVFSVESHAGDVAPVAHRIGHWLTPIRSRNSRTALTRYRSASFPGCGRWKVARAPCHSNVTEEPGPSTIRHPSETSSDSIRAHSILPLTGSDQMAFSVRRCLVFTLE